MVALKRPAAKPKTTGSCGFPSASRKAVALAAGPLEQLKEAVASEVKCGALAGAAHCVLRNGKCVLGFADGKANKENDFTLRRTLCKLHGCTKPLVACAFLTLVDKGKVKLSDPVSKYIPFAEAQPFTSGSCYTYSFCTDFLGRVCEKVSGKSLESFMKTALLEPLGMKDTHFVVPAWQHKERADGIMSGGGGILSYHDPGMWSTVEDYVKFCQMLLTGRSISGKQILRPKTLSCLWQDSLVEYGRKEIIEQLSDQDVAVVKEPPKAGVVRKGQTMWMGGGGGTYWVVDKVHHTVAVSFSQSFGGRGHSTDAAKDSPVISQRWDALHLSDLTLHVVE
eukprot:Skav214580  [mRNA]  locus=scaffold57:271253:275386:+ [translate_table: standard]